MRSFQRIPRRRTVQGVDHLSFNSAVIAFHRLAGKHTGANIARVVYYLIKRAGIERKLGHWTLDNAFSNTTFLACLRDLLAADGIIFDPVDQRICCFPHVINICAQHVIKAAGASVAQTKKVVILEDDEPTNGEDDGSDWGEDISLPIVTDDDTDSSFDDLEEEFEAIISSMSDATRRNLVDAVCAIIRYTRGSDQRKQDLERIIVTGNATELFRNAQGVPTEVKLLELIMYSATRWDSFQLMLLRIRELRPAVDLFLSNPPHNSNNLRLTNDEWTRVDELILLLAAPHFVQNSMSGEKVPLLAGAIPVFETFLTAWEKTKKMLPHLSGILDVGLKFAYKYYSKMDDTRAYVLSMLVHPAIRLGWINEHWGSDYIAMAQDTVRDTMVEYREAKASRAGTTRAPSRSSTRPVTPRSDKPAFFQLNEAFKSLNLNLDMNIRSGSEAVDEDDAEDDDKGSVEQELQAYLTSRSVSETIDVLGFWLKHEKKYPTLFAIAMDYLPIQPSSVPSERAFSSASETDTKKRNRLSPLLTEALQMMKFSIKKERDDPSTRFLEGWQTDEQELLAPPKRPRDSALLARLTLAPSEASKGIIVERILGIEGDGADAGEDSGWSFA